MQQTKDYYSILGITEEEKKLPDSEFQKVLKKKYREAAMKYHPDRWINGTDEEKKEAEDKFKDVAEANDVLSNPKKRQMYDNGGQGFTMDGSDIDPMEMFRRMSQMGGMGGFSDIGDFFFRRGGRRGIRVGKNSHYKLGLTIEEAFKGGEFSVTYNRNVRCSHCHGTGSEDGQTHSCPTCNGTGMVSDMHQNGPSMFSMTSRPCPTCHGSGKTIDNPCKHCNGSGMESVTETTKVTIPRGMGDGMAMQAEGLGDEEPGGGVNGNLVIETYIKDSGYFERPDAINVIHYEDIPFNEAMLGFTRTCKCVDGSTVTIQGGELTPHGKTFMFSGQGMPNPNNPMQRGDYVVVVQYRLPDKLTDKQRDMLKNFNNN